MRSARHLSRLRYIAPVDGQVLIDLTTDGKIGDQIISPKAKMNWHEITKNKALPLNTPLAARATRLVPTVETATEIADLRFTKSNFYLPKAEKRQLIKSIYRI